MEREHVASADSQSAFLTPNYGVSTTSEIEWFYVYNPTDEQMRSLKLDGHSLSTWPGASCAHAHVQRMPPHGQVRAVLMRMCNACACALHAHAHVAERMCT